MLENQLFFSLFRMVEIVLAFSLIETPTLDLKFDAIAMVSSITSRLGGQSVFLYSDQKVPLEQFTEIGIHFFDTEWRIKTFSSKLSNKNDI